MTTATKLQRSERPVPVPHQRLSVVIVSPFDADLISLLGILGRTSWRISWWTSCSDAVAALGKNAAPVLICERRMPDGDWKDLVGQLDSLPDAPRVIVTSSAIDDTLWAEVLNLGGYDVLLKPYDAEEVFRVVSRASRAAGSAWRQRPPLGSGARA